MCNLSSGSPARFWSFFSAVAFALVLSALPAGAQTQSVESFYQGKTITLVVGFTSGGGYDLNARAVARFLGNHIPGKPKVVIQNMPGAGSLASVNHLANVAAKDGTALASFSRGVIFEPLMGNKSAQFDARNLNWIGSPSRETNIVFVRSDLPFKTFDDLKSKEMIVAATGGGADTSTFPLMMNAVLGTKLKLVTGYPGAPEALLAMDRGEVDGMAGLSWGFLKTVRPAWIAENKVRVLLQFGLSKAPDLPNVASALDLASNDADRQLLELFIARLPIAWPIAAPAGVPAERIAALRQAFLDTMKDADYRAEADKQALEVDPVTGDEISQILARVYTSPEAVVTRAREIAEKAR
jgi:tripartite-type tricarboxylate transporter receptor subunit TctC